MKLVLWGVAARLSYIWDAWCLKVKLIVACFVGTWGWFSRLNILTIIPYKHITS